MEDGAAINQGLMILQAHVIWSGREVSRDGISILICQTANVSCSLTRVGGDRKPRYRV